MGNFISEITYEDCRTLINENTVVVLPIGGGSKEHGEHLPMGTDFYVTDFLAKRITENCDVLTLPTLPYAYFPAFIKWKGTISVEYEHFIGFVSDILLSFVRFGVKKFLIIDGGVSTHDPLMLLSRTFCNKYDVFVAVSDVTQLASEKEAELCRQKAGGHGDESETSTMLYIKKELVHMDKTTEEYRTHFPGTAVDGKVKIYMASRMETEHGTTGNSTLATKEKGEQILHAMEISLENFLEEFIPFTPGGNK